MELCALWRLRYVDGIYFLIVQNQRIYQTNCKHNSSASKSHKKIREFLLLRQIVGKLKYPTLGHQTSKCKSDTT